MGYLYNKEVSSVKLRLLQFRNIFAYLSTYGRIVKLNGLLWLYKFYLFLLCIVFFLFRYRVLVFVQLSCVAAYSLPLSLRWASYLLQSILFIRLWNVFFFLNLSQQTTFSSAVTLLTSSAPITNFKFVLIAINVIFWSFVLIVIWTWFHEYIQYSSILLLFKLSALSNLSVLVLTLAACVFNYLCIHCNKCCLFAS